MCFFGFKIKMCWFFFLVGLFIRFEMKKRLVWLNILFLMDGYVYCNVKIEYFVNNMILNLLGYFFLNVFEFDL